MQDGSSKVRVRATALIVKDNSILLVLHKKEGKEYFLLPGGGVKEGESVESAIKRELMEETGLVAIPFKFLFTTESESPDKKRFIVQKVYLCTAKGNICKSQDPRVIKSLFLSKEKFREVTFYPNIKKEILKAWDKNFDVPPENIKVEWE